MALDFYGVRIEGRIRQFPRGNLPERTVELWVEPQESQLTVFNTALAFLSQIDVTLKLGEVAQIAMVLTPPFEEGLQLINSELIRQGTGRIEVNMSYTTGIDDGRGLSNSVLPFSGFLQKPDVQVGQDIVITLIGLGAGYALTNAAGTDSEHFGPDKSVADVVQDIFSKYRIDNGDSFTLDTSKLYSRIKPQRSGPDGEYNVMDPKKGDPFFRRPPVIQGQLLKEGEKKKRGADDFGVTLIRGPRNDWWLVRELLDDYGYDMVLEANKVFIVDKTEWLADAFTRDPANRKKFLIRGNTDPTRNMYPALTYSSPTDGAWVGPGLGRVVGKDYDDSKKEDSEVVADPENPGEAPTLSKEQSYYDPDNKDAGIAGPQDAAKNLPGDPNDPAYVRKMRAEWKQSLMDHGIKCQVESIGVPNLKPGDVVDITGFEPYGENPADEKYLFNGPYGVFEVRHSVGIGGWTTSFTGVMNVWPSEMGQATQGAAAGVSEQQPIPEADAVSGAGSATETVSPVQEEAAPGADEQAVLDQRRGR